MHIEILCKLEVEIKGMSWNAFTELPMRENALWCVGSSMILMVKIHILCRKIIGVCSYYTVSVHSWRDTSAAPGVGVK